MHIVITGGTRGIGNSLTNQFLKRGHLVTFSGSSIDSVKKAEELFAKEFKKNQFHGVVSDISRPADILYLWDEASTKGPIDIWINNAGIAEPDSFFKNIDLEDIQKLININLSGSMMATKIAFNGMEKQGFGHIYNMEGFGSDGMMQQKMTLYGTSKYGIRYFTRSFYKEIKDTRIGVGLISPGMVGTELLLKPVKENPKLKKIVNILANKPETVTIFIVNKILNNKKKHNEIRWLTKPKVFFRFLTGGAFNEKVI